MNHIYVRSKGLNDRIHEIKLTIPAWKVLFALDGEMDTQAVAEFLEMSVEEVEQIAQELKNKKLIETVQPIEEAPAAASAEAEAPSEAEKVAGPETPPAESAEAVTPETPEPSVEETAETSEPEFEDIIGDLFEEELPAAEEPAAESAEAAGAAEPETEAVDDSLGLDELFKEELAESEQTLNEMLEEIEEEPQEPAAPSKDVHVDVAQKTILVVDDSVVIRKMVEIALENEESYQVVAIGSGKEALEYLDANKPDIIILDIMLPDVNGLDILKAIKANDRIKNIPVLMLSAKDTPRETSRAKELGADDFIPKPFKDEELIGKIKELIGD